MIDGARKDLRRNALGSAAGASQDIAWDVHDSGNVYREQGKYQEALPLYERDLAFWHKQGNPPFHIGWLRYDIGQIYYQLEQWGEAQSWYEKALDAFEKVRYVLGSGHVKMNWSQWNALCSVRRKLSRSYRWHRR